jgi:DNA repair protein RadC
MYLIKDMPKAMRPREKAQQLGINQLSNIELIAIILRTGSKQQSVLHLAEEMVFQQSSLMDMTEMSLTDLTSIKGIGPSKAIQIQAAFELGKRALQEQAKEAVFLTSPESIYRFIRYDVVHLKQEHFIALFFTTKGELIKHETLFVGTLNTAVVHPRVLFKKAVMVSAASFVVCHNHPSGDPTPSKQDIAVTNTIKKTAKVMDIQFMDHVIIGQNKYFSFKEKGLL